MTIWTVYLVRNKSTGRAYVDASDRTFDARRLHEELFMDVQAGGLDNFQLFTLLRTDEKWRADALLAALRCVLPHLLGENLYGPAKLETKAQVVERTTAFRRKHQPTNRLGWNGKTRRSAKLPPS